jgi:putative membrane protein
VSFFGPGIFIFPFFILFWVGVIWLIVMLVRRDRTPPPAVRPWSGPARPAAIDVLEERYARGEITREEFVERRTVLLGGDPGQPTPTPPPSAAPGPPGPLAPPTP